MRIVTNNHENDAKSNGYANSDLASNSDPQDLSSAHELRSRVESLLDLFDSRNNAATVSGKSVDMLIAYAKGRSRPPFDVMAKLALAKGVSLEWLATGEGEMRPSATSSQEPPPAAATPLVALDDELMAKIVDGISKVYKEVGARIAPADLGRLAARTYSDLAAIYDDPDDRKVGLKAILAQLQRELRSAPSGGATETKRLA